MLLNAFSRLTITASARYISTTSALGLRATPVLCAEPLKKKKKMDPAIIRAREERKKRKLEKQIRRLERNARQLKPIDELEKPLELIDEKEKRQRSLPPLTDAVIEERERLKMEWARYKHDEKVSDFQIIDRLLQSEMKALEELRLESEALYQEAIQFDVTLLPVSLKGPVATPPVPNYESPDGDYLHQTRKWESK